MGATCECVSLGKTGEYLVFWSVGSSSGCTLQLLDSEYIWMLVIQWEVLRHWCFHSLLSTIDKCLQVQVGKYSPSRHTTMDPNVGIVFVGFLCKVIGHGFI